MSKQSRLPDPEWKYDIDCGNLLCRCPVCDCRMPIYMWHYKQNYKFCPYCGVRLAEGKFRRMYEKVYGRVESWH